jgi:cytidylate kinase
MSSFIVAIDGPAGSGKSSVSKAVAKALGFAYLDTGAGYRSYALWGHKQGLRGFYGPFPYEISTDPDDVTILLNGSDVSEEIRTQAVASLVSDYAQLSEVRKLQLQDAQRRIADCPKSGIVVEGRDITTVVAPDAQVRILLTASEGARALRRGLEQSESPASLAARDAIDSKVAEFLSAPEGVTLIDTTDLDFEQSVQAVLDEIARIRGE